MSFVKDYPWSFRGAMDVDAELLTNGDKSSDAEILAEVWGEAIQKEEDDINVVYDESPAPSSAFELEKDMEVLQQLTLFCDEGEDLREVLCEVNTYSQRAIAKRKKQTTVKDYVRLWFFWMIFVLHIVHNIDSFWCIFCLFTCFIYPSLIVDTIHYIKNTLASGNQVKLKF